MTSNVKKKQFYLAFVPFFSRYPLLHNLSPKSPTQRNPKLEKEKGKKREKEKQNN